MMKRTVAAIVMTTAMAGLLVGCSSTTDNGGATPANTLKVPVDRAGESPLDGVIKIVDIDRSTMNKDGVVRYYVENLTGDLVENLVYTVMFTYPAAPNKERGAIDLPFESVGTPEQFINLAPADTRKEIAVVCPEFEQRAALGQKIQSTKLTVFEDAPAPAVVRTRSSAGSTFFGGALELVGLANDELYNNPPSFWIEIENISRASANCEVKVIFLELDGKTMSGQTKWQPLGAIQPGTSKRKDIDLTGAGRVKGKGFWIKARPLGF